MPRQSRTVFAGIYHHITQRGNRREDIFFGTGRCLPWVAVRYVERNPVRADMVRPTEDYCLSSAVRHCGKRIERLLNSESAWSKQFSDKEDWSAWLSEGDETEEMQLLRRNVDKGLPCGSEDFDKNWGNRLGGYWKSVPKVGLE